MGKNDTIISVLLYGRQLVFAPRSDATEPDDEHDQGVFGSVGLAGLFATHSNCVIAGVARR